jgi:flagellar biosynthesis component FlhA
VLDWLDGLMVPSDADGASDSESVATFLSCVCADIVAQQPHVLLGLAQAEAYAASLSQPGDETGTAWPVAPASLLPILRQVLQQRISIANTATVAEVLYARREQAPDDIAEHLVDALCPSEIEIHVPEAFLRDLTTHSDSSVAAFSSLRAGHTTELGMEYPDFRFVVDPELKPNSFAFVLNHLPTIPFVGLAHDQCMVNDRVENLRARNIEGYAASNPALWYPTTVISTEQRHLLDPNVWTIWDQMGQFILCFGDTLRKNSARFVTQRFVEQQLDRVAQPFPAVVEAAKSSVSIRQITCILRSLVAEEVSIRDIHGILERVMDYRYRALDATRYLVLDDRISTSGFLAEHWGDKDDGLAAFVRAGLKRQISHKAAHDRPTLVAYLVDQKIEEALIGRHLRGAGMDAESGDDTVDHILAAIRTELAYMASGTRPPCILTTQAARPLLREVTRLVFPGLTILCYQDITPSFNVQPIARISLR